MARYAPTVALSLHGHVHANTLTWWHGIPFVTLASTTEYPLQWHELRLWPCVAKPTAAAAAVPLPPSRGLLLLQRPLLLPLLRAESARRDTRPNRNRIKRGDATGQSAVCSSAEEALVDEHEEPIISTLSVACT